MTLTDFLLPVILVLNASYVYFWVVVVYARVHGHIDRAQITNSDVIRARATALQNGDPDRFIIQITTKGGSLPVVRRGIHHALNGVRKFPALRPIVSIEVITEDEGEAAAINRRYANCVIPIVAILLPADYRTEGGTKLKARALHYMVEQHRLNPTNSYVVHYDEESVFTASNLARLACNLMEKPVGISEGTISYGLDWSDAHVLCRTMESNRPFGCHECYVMMTHPAPLHLHGSNLVIQQKLENDIGWDIGLYEGNALIAEDLVFGLMAYLKFGGSVFGWHYVEMIEQPPFTLNAAHKQRERWVMGALQGVNHVSSLPGWLTMTRGERWKIQGVIRLRILTYALGFPVSLISLSALVFLLATAGLDWSLGGVVHWHLSILALPGLAMWLGSNQIGLRQNLGYTTMSRRQKLVEHAKVFACTPIAGIVDTYGPFRAVIKWSLGRKSVTWIPTPKLAVEAIK